MTNETDGTDLWESEVRTSVPPPWEDDSKTTGQQRAALRAHLIEQNGGQTNPTIEAMAATYLGDQCDDGRPKDHLDCMIEHAQAWMREKFPGALGCALYVWAAEGLPPTRITIPASCESPVVVSPA